MCDANGSIYHARRFIKKAFRARTKNRDAVKENAPRDLKPRGNADVSKEFLLPEKKIA